MTYIKIDKFSSAEIEIEKSDLGISIINLKDTSDLDSLLSTEFTQHIEKGKTVELIKITNILSIIFSIYLVIFLLINFGFLPKFCHTYYNSADLFLKLSNDSFFFSHFYSELHIFSKTLLNLNHIFLLTLMISLYHMYNKSYASLLGLIAIILTGLVSIISMINLTFNYENSMNFTRRLGLSDNLFYCTYLVSICILFNKFNSVVFKKNTSNQSNLINYITYLIATNTVLFIGSSLMVSYYGRLFTDDISKVFLVTIIVCKEINSFLFHLNVLFYILTIKSALILIEWNITIKPEIECTVSIEDIEANNKFTF